MHCTRLPRISPLRTYTVVGLLFYCTVQAPRVCQPEKRPPTDRAYPKRLLAPAKAVLKVKERFRVSVFADHVALEVAPLTVHCEFCNVAAMPKVMGPSKLV